MPAFETSGVMDLDLNFVGDTNESKISSDVEAEIRRLKLELKHTMKIYNAACKEAIASKETGYRTASVTNRETCKIEPAHLAEEAAPEMEKAKRRSAIEVSERAKGFAMIETRNQFLCRKYTIEEIEEATNNFEASLRIGEGGYGPVLKVKLDHSLVAIKVLRPDAAQGEKQFHQEG